MNKKQKDKLLHGAMQNLDTASPKDLKRAIRQLKKTINENDRKSKSGRLIT